MPPHRILYIGDDVALPGLLNDALKPLDCFVARCSNELLARIFLEHGIKYALLLFDEPPSGVTSARTQRLADTLKEQGHFPFLLLEKSVELAALVKTIRQVLNI
jgi:hypothetical protein